MVDVEGRALCPGSIPGVPITLPEVDLAQSISADGRLRNTVREDCRMQNYEQILAELGIKIPEDKKADLKKKFDENYRTKADYDKAIIKRDEYKASLDDVQTQLEEFKDVDDLKTQISTLTTQLANEKKAHDDDTRKAALEKTVDEFFATVDEKGEKVYDFLNDITANHYREELSKALDSDSAKGKSIVDIFKGMITDADGKQKAGIFVDKQQAAAQQNAAKFTKPAQQSGASGQKYTMSQLMKMKNENPDLDISQYMQ